MRRLDSIRQIYYRGLLRSCNYTCSYCPFGRKSPSGPTSRDEQTWRRFVAAMAAWRSPVRLFLIPYGEALVHAYYREGIAQLSTLPHVRGVGCQTNLSYPAQAWLEELRQSGVEVGKIHLWASFHPEMTSVRRFVDQLHRLHEAGLQVCAGAVGKPDHLALLQELRDSLSPDIYLFVNAMQGLKRGYTAEETLAFSRIDNLFAYDVQNAAADWEHCMGRSESCFVDGWGNVRACPRSRTVLGNLYGGLSLEEVPCTNRRCDCYIAFSNLIRHPLRQVMGEGMLWRTPEKMPVSAVFFDVDGTLTGADGRVPDSYAEALRWLSRRVPLYLATSLTEDLARRRLGHSLFVLFRGGIFADGASLRGEGWSECLPLLPLSLPQPLDRMVKVTAHQDALGHPYKYSLLPDSREEIAPLLEWLGTQPYRVSRNRRLITLIHPQAGKKEGFLRFCARLGLPTGRVLAVGNEISDADMLACTPLSCAVLTADEALKQRVRYVLNPDRLAAFFHFSK